MEIHQIVTARGTRFFVEQWIDDNSGKVTSIEYDSGSYFVSLSSGGYVEVKDVVESWHRIPEQATEE